MVTGWRVEYKPTVSRVYTHQLCLITARVSWGYFLSCAGEWRERGRLLQGWGRLGGKENLRITEHSVLEVTYQGH